MSYNCDLWKTKELKDFMIPVESLFKGTEDWHPDRINNDDGTVTFEMCEATLHGVINDTWFIVKSIDCSGEGSGSAMHYVLEPAFEDSLGILVASCVWERGDSINQITVENGKVSWKDIEI